MNLLLFITQAFSSIISNKLRSFLSTLWVIIGISSFVIMLSLWEWAKQSILQEMWWSANIITINNYGENTGNIENPLTEKNIETLKEIIPNTNHIFTNYRSYYWNIHLWETPIYGEITGIEKKHFQHKEISLLHGQYFSSQDYEEKAKRAIVWYGVVWDILRENAQIDTIIWKKINIWWELFIIQGILEEKNWNFDYKIFIPLPTLKYVLWTDTIENIEIDAQDENSVESVNNFSKAYFSKVTWVENYRDTGLNFRTNKESAEQIQWFITKFSLLLWWIWAIALIVWWIWIMNIMLVSVTERTREIWIRKAIWASNTNILLQFLIESIILTLIWSIIALLISMAAVALIDTLIPDFSPIINVNVIIIATTVSIIMWMLSGLLPAYKAARLKPIDALHYE